MKIEIKDQFLDWVISFCIVYIPVIPTNLYKRVNEGRWRYDLILRHFSTVFQSYLCDRRVIMNDYFQSNRVIVEKISSYSGS